MKIKAAKWGDELTDETVTFWNSLGVETEWVEIADEIKNQPELIFKSAESFDVAFLEASVGEAVTSAAKECLSEVRGLGWADTLVKEGKHLWPQLFALEALRLSIIQAVPELDTHSVGYVTGRGPLARMAIVSLIQLGFERLALVSENPTASEEEMQAIQKKYFDIHIHFINDSEMTMQPNNGSIIVNTISHEKESEILEDLPYLNYIKKSGLVVDLPLAQGRNQLIEEAEHVGMRVLGGWRVRGRRDLLLLQRLAQAQGIACPENAENALQQWLQTHDVGRVTENVTTQKN
jgi:hypothetical protein